MLAGRVSLRLLLVAASVAQGAAASAVTIDWVTVGDPGNAADDTGFGSVAQVYRIAETEVTNAQYAEFLDAVAATDTNGLYNASMSSSAHGGITQSGSPGSFDYGVKPGFAPKPVNFVSFYDSLRFANWLHNGQLAGAQDATTTEDGAYTITAQGVADNTITRNAGASIFLTSEDEWYKAAYYDAGSAGYFDYPVGSDLETLCTALAALPNAANCDSAVGTVTDAGSYTLAPSPAGTFDQAGNVFEWNEAIISGSVRGLRGGSWFSDPADQAASFRPSGDPTVEISNLGFRVASVPEPGTGLLVAAGMLGLAGWRRRRAHIAAAFLVTATLASSAGGAVCSNISVPVALAAGQPVDQQVFGRLCEPGAGPGSSTLLVLVHGITYDHDYWDFPDPTGGTARYSFTAAGLTAGFSTLSIDRIGAGSSSHPLSALVTIDSNAHTVHQVIQAVRNGAITDGGGGVFDTVVLVGHSYGSWTTWFEATRYNDIDAVVLTGATHGLTTVDAPFIVIPGLYPALLDPRFGPLSGLDAGYQTTQPGKRYKAFYAPGPVDPAVVEHDEATKETVTSAELQNYQLILAEPLDIRVPVFLTVGAVDTLFCGPALGGAPCTSEQALINFEAPFLGPNVPSIDAYILPAGGHDMNQMLNSQLYFQRVLDWVEATASGLP